MTTKNVFKKIGKAVALFLVGIVEFLGLCLIASAEAREKELEIERKVAERNYEAEKMIIRRDDTENLKGHVMRIIREDTDSWFGASYEGKNLLKREGNMSKEDFNKKLYNFVIEYGL